MPSAALSEESAVSLSTIPISPAAAPSNKARRASLKVLNRNIDTVVLGSLLFRTWYYSPYPDSIILGEDHASSSISNVGAGFTTATTAIKHQPQTVLSADSNGAAERSISSGHNSVPTAVSTARVTSAPIPCERLHVCPYCFRYTPKADLYVQHLRRHNVSYNPRDLSSSSQSSVIDAERDDLSSISGETSEDTSTWPVPSSALKVYEHDGYTVWDVDGDREKLYCQNLSLFGKLFLEQKSVFFDTSGFHYFVLTYTPPSPKMSTASPENMLSKRRTSGSNRSAGRRRTLSNTAVKTESDTISSSSQTTPTTLPPDITLRTRVLGFFSKENLSWDANNLACILVFPPYQHRNLGQLLMAVSYKLSGWEWEGSVIGGPEKPLSAMGRRSYLRFWSERVARFLMGQTADADGRRVFHSDDSGNEDDDDDGRHAQGEVRKRKKKKKQRKRKNTGFAKEEVTIKELGERTGMLAEDVIAALSEMGVLEVVSPKKKKRRKSDGDESAVPPEEEMLSSMIVQRSKVLEWVEGKRIDLVSPVKEEGFLGEWALSDPDDEVMDDDEVDETE